MYHMKDQQSQKLYVIVISQLKYFHKSVIIHITSSDTYTA